MASASRFFVILNEIINFRRTIPDQLYSQKVVFRNLVGKAKILFLLLFFGHILKLISGSLIKFKITILFYLHKELHH